MSDEHKKIDDGLLVGDDGLVPYTRVSRRDGVAEMVAFVEDALTIMDLTGTVAP